MNFKILGTKIYVSFFFTAVVTIMLATDRTGIALPTIFAVILHEIGHLFAMWVLDCVPKQVKLIPASVQITSNFSKRYRNDILIALCGPVINLILFLTLYFNYLCFKNELVLHYALINLLVGSFNLLPVSGLDGGTVLFCLLVKKIEFSRSKLIVKLVTLLFAVIILIIGITLTVRGKVNLSLYILGLYFLIIAIMKN